MKSRPKSSIDAPDTVAVVATGSPVPEPPSFLGRIGKSVFNAAVQDLVQMKLADRADMRVLEAFASAYEEWRTARDHVDKHGATYSYFTKDGEVRVAARPEVELATNAWMRWRNLLPDLYLTPQARVKNGPKDHKPEPPKNPLAGMLGIPRN